MKHGNVSQGVSLVLALVLLLSGVVLAAPAEAVEECRNPAVAEGLASILDRLEIVYGYRAGEGAGGWTHFNPDWVAFGLNTLDHLHEGRGYWVRVSEACTLAHADARYALDGGWNLIGWLGSAG